VFARKGALAKEGKPSQRGALTLRKWHKTEMKMLKIV
jgi:hypothetical protein